MNERKKQLQAILKLLICIGFAILYAWGGMEYKWLRRFVAPLLLAVILPFYTKDWRFLIQIPFMFLSLSLGYGATQFWVKVLKRGLFGLANSLTSSIYLWIRKKWLLFGFQVVLLISAYIIFGVFNPFPDARTEELVLGFLVVFIPVMGIDKKREV